MRNSTVRRDGCNYVKFNKTFVMNDIIPVLNSQNIRSDGRAGAVIDECGAPYIRRNRESIWLDQQAWAAKLNQPHMWPAVPTPPVAPPPPLPQTAPAAAGGLPPAGMTWGAQPVSAGGVRQVPQRVGAKRLLPSVVGMGGSVGGTRPLPSQGRPVPTAWQQGAVGLPLSSSAQHWPPITSSAQVTVSHNLGSSGPQVTCMPSIHG